jgi:diguanylate cyclase (GGDEF)-like protein
VMDLRTFADRLAGSVDMAVVCEAGAEALLAAAGGESARVAVFGPSGAFTVWATAGAPCDWLGELRVAPEGGFAGRAASERRLLRLEGGQIVGEPGEALGPLAVAADLTSIAVPLSVEDRVLGVAQIVGGPTGGDAVAAAATVCGFLSVAVDRARLYDQARFEHAIDRVTGLWNYADFRQRLLEEMDRARRHETALSLLRIDVDGFQQLNKRLGYRAADGILAELATLVRASLRATDVAARLGPDEFALILPETAAEGARVAADNLCQHVRERTFSAGDEQVRVTVSCGGVEIGSDDQDEDVLRASAEALAEAKQRGGDAATFAGD